MSPAVLGIVRHTLVFYHAQHHVLELAVKVSVRHLTDVGTHGLLVPGLGQLALSSAVHRSLAVLVLDTAHHLGHAVVADTGRDSKEIRVRGHPSDVLIHTPGSYEDTDVEN